MAKAATTSAAPGEGAPAAALLRDRLRPPLSDQGIAKLPHSGRGELSECPCAGVSVSREFVLLSSCVGNARSSVAAAFARVFAVASGPFVFRVSRLRI